MSGVKQPPETIPSNGDESVGKKDDALLIEKAKVDYLELVLKTLESKQIVNIIEAGNEESDFDNFFQLTFADIKKLPTELEKKKYLLTLFNRIFKGINTPINDHEERKTSDLVEILSDVLNNLIDDKTPKSSSNYGDLFFNLTGKNTDIFNRTVGEHLKRVIKTQFQKFFYDLLIITGNNDKNFG